MNSFGQLKAQAIASAEERELLQQWQVQNRNTEQQVARLNRRMDDAERRVDLEPHGELESEFPPRNVLHRTTKIFTDIHQPSRQELGNASPVLDQDSDPQGTCLIRYPIQIQRYPRQPKQQLRVMQKGGLQQGQDLNQLQRRHR
jgi:hypothetical protein